MLRSMTAFARKQVEDGLGTLVWEVRSVNHRFLDLSFKLPEGFRLLESQLRERAAQKIQRGKVDCYLYFRPNAAALPSLTLNPLVVQSLLNCCEQICQQNNALLQPSTMEILRWPGACQESETDWSPAFENVKSSFEEVMQILILQRAREGEALRQLIEERLECMVEERRKLQSAQEQNLTQKREKWKEKFRQLALECDPLRLEQEMVLLAQKMDVSEELERLEIHLNEMYDQLRQGGAVGRRLDFLLQELNREANTLSAKVNDAKMSQSAVELKICIEQIREQVQNIE